MNSRRATVKVQAIKEFKMGGKKYLVGEFLIVTNEIAQRLANDYLIKYRIAPVAHKMIEAPNLAKETEI
jgi:hypothetical protein